MLVATFGPTTGRAGKTITYEDGVFNLEGHGPISARDVLSYDAQGHLTWAYDGLRGWVRQMPASGAATPKYSGSPSTSSRLGTPGIGIAGFVLSLLGISLIGVILSWIGYAQAKREGRPRGLCLAGIIIGFALPVVLGLVAIPMFLGQRDLAKESAVREGIHSVQIGVQSYAVDNADAYPPASMMKQADMSIYVTNWPENPYAGLPMSQGTEPGDFSYTVGPGGVTFELVGCGEDGPVITVA